MRLCFPVSVPAVKCLFASMLSVVSFSLLSSSGHASWYPPGYAVETNCQQQYHVKVCAYNQHQGNYPRISIEYFHPFALHFENKLNVNVKFNGKESFFSLRCLGGSCTETLNNPVSRLCAGKDRPESDQYPHCKDSSLSGLNWEIVELSPVGSEKLFEKLVDAQGNKVAWDVRLSFFDVFGNWDSLNGQDYKFRFE